MTLFFKKGNTYNIAADGAIDIRKELPPCNYVVQYDIRAEIYFLESIDSFKLPPKLYGDVIKNTERIINTFNQRPTSTGLLLTGDKGTGKTMLAKNLSCVLAEAGVPTIIINEDWRGDNFNKFLQSIEQPCVVLFDEFEKTYNREKQEPILTLLDGVYPTKKLFIFTSNSIYHINENMFNRPGRIFYAIRYTGLEDAFIREYCNDNLNNISHLDQVCKISALFGSFNFDLLKALIEEMNRYDESPQESLRLLNAIPEDSERNRYSVIMALANGVNIPAANMYNEGAWYGNPLAPAGVKVSYKWDNTKPSNNECFDKEPPITYTDYEDEYYEDRDSKRLAITMMSTDLKSIDAVHGIFDYTNKAGDTLRLTKVRTAVFNYHVF